MNNCIGERNARYFVLFLWITSITTIYIISFSLHYILWNILTDSDARDRASKYSPMAYTGLGVTALGAWLVA